MSPSDAEIIAEVADELPLGIWVARAPGGELVFANAAFRAIMGMEARADVAVGEYAAPYAIHRSSGELYPEEDMPFVRALQQRKPVTVDDIVIHRRDGRQVSVRAHARPIFDGPEGAMSHVIIAFEDITREVRAERERAHARERIERMQRMETVGNLAGGVAHDFNNLLSAIQAIAGSLEEGEQDRARAAHLRTIQDISESAAALARRLLDFAGSRGGERAPVSIRSVIGRVLANLAPSIEGLMVETDLDGPLEVVGDGARLEQIVMNLVLNARDAGARRLAIRGRSSPDICLEFEDDGPGIPPEHKEQIFEPYVTSKAGNSGLGLATVLSVVASHSGDVVAEDTPHGGARFVVTLPAPPFSAG